MAPIITCGRWGQRRRLARLARPMGCALPFHGRTILDSMPQAHQPAWRVLVTPRWIGWHLFAVVTIAGMLWLGDWQFHRALSGNTLSWAYTFEWPIFAVFGVVFWAKTIRDELRQDPAQAAESEPVTLPAGIRPAARSGGHPELDGDAEPPDPELAEYNAYLAKLAKETRGHGRWHGLR